jgi:uncharacterized cupin superfamily protein
MKRLTWLVCTALAACVVVAAQAPQKKTIVRLSPQGPAPSWGVSATEPTKTHFYYRVDAPKRVSAGIWEAASLVNDIHPKTDSEFMHLLEGSVVMIDKDGRQETFKAGDTAFVPRGTQFAWKQTGKLRKFFATFDRETPQSPAPEGKPTFMKLEPDGPKGAQWTTRENTRMYRYYSDKDGATVGVWEATNLDDPKFRAFTYAEMMVFLTGAMTMTTADGQQEVFKAGEVALIPKGLDVKLKADNVRIYFVTFDRDPPKAGTQSQ